MTKEQLKLLKEISEGKEVNVREMDSTTKELVHFLRTSGAVDYDRYQNTETGEHLLLVKITEQGKMILFDAKSQKRSKRAEWIRYIITTVIAALALVLAGISLAAQLGLISLPRA